MRNKIKGSIARLRKNSDSSDSKDNKDDHEHQKNLDKKLVLGQHSGGLPSISQLRQLPKLLDARERLILWISLGLLAFGLLFIGGRFYFTNFLPTPVSGGEYTEGLIGAPQFVNPLLSQTNDVDSDLSRLLFSGLLRYDKDLNLVPDLATEYTINEDQTVYEFKLREDATWHDGTPLTADDVVFTILSIQDPEFKSPLLVSLRGIEIEKVDVYTVRFILPESFRSFLETMTFGILPEHIWGTVPAINANLTEYNLKPIGSGPWIFESLSKDRLGNIKAMKLARNEDFYGQVPFIKELTFKFYPDFITGVAALKNHSVEGLSFLPKELKKDLNGSAPSVYSFHLPQHTTLFFNQSQNINLKADKVRQALAQSIDRSLILSEALQLEGELIDGPIPPGYLGYHPNLATIEFTPESAADLLTSAGWDAITPEEYRTILEEKIQAESEKNNEENENGENEESPDNDVLINNPTPDEILDLNTDPEEQNFIDESINQLPYYRQKGDEILEITLTTVNQPENVTAAELIQGFWQNIGVVTNLNIVDPTKISREVIKARQYEILLFGEIFGADPDPYPFWHSSQADDPGLNLALFADRRVDKLLEDARESADPQVREDKYREFQEILSEEMPAIFLYSPTYTYLVDDKVKGIATDRLIVPADRLNNLSNWYIKTSRKWHPEL